MTSDLDIHPDFHAIKERELSLKRYRLALINGILALLGWLERRKFAPIITREKICAPDGRRVPGHARHVSSSIDLVFVAKAIERVGDHAKNLCEAVIYIVEGTDIRVPLETVEDVVR